MSLFDRISKLFVKGKKPPVISSTTEHPSPRDVFLFLLEKLEEEGGEFVTFVDQDFWIGHVQVSFVPDGTHLLFSFPFDEVPEQIISRLQITFPTGFELESWEKQLYAIFVGPRIRHSELANIVDDLFVKLLKSRLNYVVQGRIQDGSYSDFSIGSIQDRIYPVGRIHTFNWSIAGSVFILMSIACLAITIWALVNSISGISTTGPVKYFFQLFIFLGVCAIFGYGGYRLVISGKFGADAKDGFDKTNTTTEAKVLRRYIEHVVTDDEFDVPFVVVQFETRSGQVTLRARYYGNKKTFEKIFDEISPANKLKVRYADSDPRIALFESEY